MPCPWTRSKTSNKFRAPQAWRNLLRWQHGGGMDLIPAELRAHGEARKLQREEQSSTTLERKVCAVYYTKSFVLTLLRAIIT